MKQTVSPAMAVVIVVVVVLVVGLVGYKLAFTQHGIDAPPPKNIGRASDYTPAPAGSPGSRPPGSGGQ